MPVLKQLILGTVRSSLSRPAECAQLCGEHRRPITGQPRAFDCGQVGNTRGKRVIGLFGEPPKFADVHPAPVSAPDFEVDGGSPASFLGRPAKEW